MHDWININYNFYYVKNVLIMTWKGSNIALLTYYAYG